MRQGPLPWGKESHMKRLAVVLLVVLLVVGACLYGPGLLKMVKADLGDFSGSSDYGTTLDGIGTFCHEFSHCLGLPDFYETTYSHGYFGMSYWSLMNTGCYYGLSIDGDTPIGYSAYEKNFMNWIDLIEPVENTKYTLPVFNSKTLANDQAIKITALNENEYWILENRAKQGWDYCIEDEGVLITHFTYIESRWDENSVNDQSIQLATIIPADNSLSDYNLDKDLYGETNHAFTASSTPAMKANMKANGSLASSTGGAGTVDKPVTEINLNSDGTASLWYMKGTIVKETPQLTDTAYVTSNGFYTQWEAVPNVTSYTLEVKDLDVAPTSELLLKETFVKFTSTSTSDCSSSLDNYMDNTGWTGSKLYREVGGIRLGTSTAKGTLTSPALNLGDMTTVTVKLKAKNYNNDTNVNFTVSYGNVSKTITNADEESSYDIVLDNVTTGGKVSIATTTNRKRIIITDLEIYAGDASEAAQAPRRATETGNADKKIINGITDNFYTVTGLNEGDKYSVRVKALYTDDTESEWSNAWQVQLHGASTVLPGDVNGDGVVDVQDVSATVAYILNNPIDSFNAAAADIDGNGTVDVQDVSAIIAIILDVTN